MEATRLMEATFSHLETGSALFFEHETKKLR